LIKLAKLAGIRNGKKRKMRKMTKVTISIFLRGLLKELKLAGSFGIDIFIYNENRKVSVVLRKIEWNDKHFYTYIFPMSRFFSKAKKPLQQKQIPKPPKPPKPLNPLFVPTEQYLESVRSVAYLGKKGYTVPKTVLSTEDYTFLKDQLYVKPMVMGKLQEEGAFAVYRENDAKMYLPRFYGIKRYGLPNESEIQTGEETAIQFAGSLRDYQEKIVKTYADHVLTPICCGSEHLGGGGILEVPCGRGKTVMGLKIITALCSEIGKGKKTIILVHKEFLMNQWIERIADFLPSARVGKIQANKLEIEGKDIVIGMIQTLYSRDFPSGTFDSFGLTIIDEVHHIGSEMFSKTLLKIVTPYILGISATVERKDKLTKVLYMFIGDKIYSEERKTDDAVMVHGIYYKTADEEFSETEYDFKGQPKYSTMITKLCNYGPRSDFIVKVLTDVIEMCRDKQDEDAENIQNGQVMILSHNRSLLTYLYDAIVYRNIASVGYYVGGMKERDLKATEEKRIVLATYSMAAEALDIKTLSILIMVTPKKDIEQSVGRILRVKHKNPMVIDLIDPHPLFQNQWQTRKRFYKKCNYGILTTDSAKYQGFNRESWNNVFTPVGTTCKLVDDDCEMDKEDNTEDNIEIMDQEQKQVIMEQKEQKEKPSRLAKYMQQNCV